MKIKFDSNIIKIMTIFESVTQSKLKYCLELNERLIFIVSPGEIGKAIGKNAVNVKKLESMLNKKIRIIEFDPELEKFVAKVIFPIKITDLKVEDNIVTLTPVDSSARGLLIGRAAQNLRFFEKVIKRYFPIKEIKVI